MSTETELKLRLDPAILPKLRRHPLVTRFKTGRPRSQLLKSVYFDTPDQELRHRQLVLRVRHIGRRRVQTLKTEGIILGGTRMRGEWECEISGDQPEPEGLRATGIALFAGNATPVARLKAQFTTDIHRTTYLLSSDDWDVELAIDQGEIVADGRSVTVCEAELELKRGGPLCLFDLALTLLQDIPAEVTTATKSDRGYDLASGAGPAPAKAPAISLTADMSSGDAFRHIARSCLEHYLRNQDCLSVTRAPEAVHQMRVALRRLRSAISVFGDFLATPETLGLRRDLSEVLGPLGRARDADVFQAEIVDPTAPLLSGEPGYARLCSDIARERRDAYDEVMTQVRSARTALMTIRLGRWIEAGDWSLDQSPDMIAARQRAVGDLARSALRKRDLRLSRDLRQLDRLSAEERHQARIQVKKMRYSIDFFGSLLRSRRIRTLGALLAQLQDRLGYLNDIAVARRHLRRLADQSQDPERLWTAGLIAGWQAARAEALLGVIARDWKRYDSLPRKWRVTGLDRAAGKAEEIDTDPGRPGSGGDTSS